MKSDISKIKKKNKGKNRNWRNETPTTKTETLHKIGEGSRRHRKEIIGLGMEGRDTRVFQRKGELILRLGKDQQQVSWQNFTAN